MRQSALGVTIVALVSLVACQKNGTASDDLAADLASVSASSELALAPSMTGRNTVSSVEQLAPRVHRAPSRRSAPHRTPHVDRQSPTVAEVSVPLEPEPEATPVVAEAPGVFAPRPHPVDPDAGTIARGDGDIGDQGGDAGRIIGTIFGVVIRGGVADRDHCDPRPGRRSGPHISIGRTIPNVQY